MTETRALLEAFVMWQFRRAEMAEMVGDAVTWEDATDAERDALRALWLLDTGQW